MLKKNRRILLLLPLAALFRGAGRLFYVWELYESKILKIIRNPVFLTVIFMIVGDSGGFFVFGSFLRNKFSKTFVIPSFLMVMFMIANVIYKGTLLGVAIAATCSAI